MPALFFKASLLCLFLGAAATNISAQTSIANDARLQQLESHLFDYVDEKKLGNLTYALWQDGTLIASKGAGLARKSGGSLASDTTIYRIYSMTKPVTAVGLLILKEQRHFELEDPITKFLPEFEDTRVLADYDDEGEMYTYRPVRPPTMNQLLSHTAGFVYGAPGRGFLDDKLAALKPIRSVTTDDLVNKVASVPYKAMPGAEFRYSIASDLQGAIIERITGESLADFLEREVFVPLGMDDTGFYVDAEDLWRLSDVTSLEGNKLTYTTERSARYRVQAANFYEGGEGLFSTQQDYLKFAKLLLNNGKVEDTQILREDSVRLLQTNAIKYRGLPSRQGPNGDAAGQGFGYGVATVEDQRLAGLNAPNGTYFWYGALGSWFWIDPENNITFVGMTQSHSVTGYELLKLSINTIYPEPPVEIAMTGSAAN